MCGRSEAARSLQEAAEALTKACEGDALSCSLRIAFAVPQEVPDEWTMLLHRIGERLEKRQ